MITWIDNWPGNLSWDHMASTMCRFEWLQVSSILISYLSTGILGMMLPIQCRVITFPMSGTVPWASCLYSLLWSNHLFILMSRCSNSSLQSATVEQAVSVCFGHSPYTQVLRSNVPYTVVNEFPRKTGKHSHFSYAASLDMALITGRARILKRGWRWWGASSSSS